jgi:hypothetical protein
VQFAGNPLQTHRGFRAQPSGQGDLFGVALAAFRQFGGGPPEPLQLFRHQAAGLFLVPFPPFPAIVAGAGRLPARQQFLTEFLIPQTPAAAQLLVVRFVDGSDPNGP